jgi:Tfp pilus assembly protein PilV
LVASHAHPSHRRLASERGSVMIEALVSAVLVGIMAAAFFGALNGSERVSGVAKLRAESAALAQDDQERLRSMPVTALNNLVQSKTSQVAGINFTVDSRADWIADKVKAATCTSNGGAADYLKITSTVTPKVASSLAPVAITSTVTPAPGSFAGKGSLAVKVVDRNGIGVAAVPVDVTGPATAAAFTDATGCAFFGYLPAGTTYSVGLNKGNYVDPDGDPTPHIGVTINDQQVATQGFTYDVAGQAKLDFLTDALPATGTTPLRALTSSQWIVTMSNGSHVRPFGPGAYSTAWPFTSGSPVSTLTTPTTLFPFTSAYGIYAGNCDKNDPNANGLTDPGLIVLPAILGTYAQKLPALNVLAKQNGAPTAGLNVTFRLDPTAPGSKSAGCASYTIGRKSIAGGVLDDPGLPFGSYDVCVDNGTRRQKLGVLVDNVTLPGTPALVPVDVTGSSALGKCPGGSGP